jgi:hypothetical protein
MGSCHPCRSEVGLYAGIQEGNVAHRHFDFPSRA